MNSSEMIGLNNEFRKKDSDTNILSFPASSELKKRSGELGDIAISVPYAKNEIQNVRSVFNKIDRSVGVDHI